MESASAFNHSLGFLRKYSDFHIFVQRWIKHGASPKHDHLFHEIVLVEKGTADHRTCAGVRKLHPGDLIILKPRAWHAYENPESLTLINCLFSDQLFKSYDLLFSMVENAFSLFRKRSRAVSLTPPTVLHTSPAQRAELLHDLQFILDHFRLRKGDWKAVVTVRFLGFLVAVSQLDQALSEEKEPALENRAKEAIIETVAYLEQHFSEDMMLDDLAKNVHLSPHYLSRCFKQQMGMSIFQYLNHLRIEEGCRLLRYTLEPVGRIASMVGYDEITYFSNRFRQEIGMSPSQYRKLL